jgi:hypothetical protein
MINDTGSLAGSLLVGILADALSLHAACVACAVTGIICAIQVEGNILFYF